MKPIETVFKSKKKYAVIMLLCLLYGGFSIISFAYGAYSSFWRTELIDSRPAFDLNSDFNNANPALRALGNAPRPQGSPELFFASPERLSGLIGGIISIIAGLAIWGLTREKEIKSIKEHVAVNLLLPDERKIIEALKAGNNEATQSRLVKETGLSKVQVHRALKRLEAKGALEKHDFGMTNKILLKKELFE